MKKIYRFSIYIGLFTILITSINFIYRSSEGRIRTQQVEINHSDTLFSKPHDVYPDELIKQIPHSDYPPGVTFGSSDVPAPFDNINISQNTAPQNEPSVRFSRFSPGRVVAAWRDFRTGVSPAIRRVGFSLSTDYGSTWSISQLLPLPDPAHPRTSDPAVGVDMNGNFYIATISIDNFNSDGTIIVYKSTNGGVSFDTGYIAAHSTSGFGEDKEYITSDLDPASPFANTLYISWTRFTIGQQILLTKSTNGGVNWSNPPAQVSDVSFGVQGSDPAVGNRGEIYVVWDGPGGITFDKSTDGGNTFGTDLIISAVGSTNGFPSIAVTPIGVTRISPLYVVWSDARNGDYDVFFSASFDKGSTWTPAKRVNDDLIGNGKLQYWPWISVNDEGEIAIVYYDTRNTPSNSIIEAYLATSTDRGVTFTNELLSTQQSPTNQPNSDVRFGDYIGIDFQGNRIVPVWTDERAGGFDMEIYTAVVDITIVGTEPIAGSIPDEYGLGQNYPNPFNPVTTISFDIPKLTYINLSVLDITGKVVSAIVNEEKEAGHYSIKWDGSNYSSGVYFYRLRAGNFVDTKKMILLK
jgi:hypothetical protein